MSVASAVEFSAYRQYEATRQEANNAIMALLAGSKLAAHTLQLTAGSRSLLPDIFPGVEHINYFNLRTDVATELLIDSGHHLGAVAVPYALAVHEDFVMTTVDLLRQFSIAVKAPGRSRDPAKNPVKAWNMHEALYMTLGAPVPSLGAGQGVGSTALQGFHLLREMRNCHIHAGGVTAGSPRLAQAAADIGPLAAAEWERLARRSHLDVVADTRLRFTTFDIFAVFATTKTLGRELNALLRASLGADQWAQLCVQDYLGVSSKAVRSDPWLRGLRGHADALYGAAAIPDGELIAAARAVDAWAGGQAIPARRPARRRRPGTGRPDPAVST